MSRRSPLTLTQAHLEEFSPIKAVQASGQLLQSYLGLQRTPKPATKLLQGRILRKSRFDFLDEDIIIDDDDAEVVLVFPKVGFEEELALASASRDLEEPTEEGSSSDCSANGSHGARGPMFRHCGCPSGGLRAPQVPEVKDPFEKATKIFRCGEGVQKREGYVDFSNLRGKSAVPLKVFEWEVRQQLFKLLRGYGLRVTSFASIDDDEVFWKISADDHVIQSLAEHTAYRIPLTEQVYKHLGMEVPYVAENWDLGLGKWCSGEKTIPVFMHAKYSHEHRQDFQGFTSRDRLRLVFDTLREMVDLQEMQAQNVISCYVLVPKFDEVRALKHAVRLCKWPMYPTKKEIQVVRDFFGEQIGFFFNFIGIYIQCLSEIAVFSVPICLYNWTNSHPSSRDSWDLALGALVTIQIEAFRVRTRRESLVLQRIWDMHVNGAIQREPILERNEGYIRVSQPEIWGIIITFAYLYLLINVLMLIWWNHGKQDSWLLTLSSVGLGVLWQKVAHQIVLSEHHDTQASFTASLTAKVPYVRLFSYIFPIVFTAVFGAYINVTCGTTLDDAAWRLFDKEPPYRGAPFDTNLFYDTFNHDSKADLDYAVWHMWSAGVQPESSTYNHVFHEIVDRFKRHSFYARADEEDRVCLVTDTPTECVLVRGIPVCRGAIYDQTTHGVLRLFWLHVLFSFASLVFPTVRLRLAARFEIISKKDANATYTWLQFWRKSYDVAPYGYQQWGGSHVEDYTETVTCLAVVACFAVVMPQLIPIALAVQIVEYKLLAIRFTQVTCRPFPMYADGIGMWDEVINFTSLFALTVNGMLVFNFSRCGMFAHGTDEKLMLILGGLVALMLIRRACTLIFNVEPKRVRLLNLVEAELTKRRRPLIPSQGIDDSPRIWANSSRNSDEVSSPHGYSPLGPQIVEAPHSARSSLGVQDELELTRQPTYIKRSQKELEPDRQHSYFSENSNDIPFSRGVSESSSA